MGVLSFCYTFPRCKCDAVFGELFTNFTNRNWPTQFWCIHILTTPSNIRGWNFSPFVDQNCYKIVKSFLRIFVSYEDNIHHKAIHIKIIIVWIIYDLSVYHSLVLVWLKMIKVYKGWSSNFEFLTVKTIIHVRHATPEINDNSLFVQQHVQANIEENIKALRYLAFVWESSFGWPVDSSHPWPVFCLLLGVSSDYAQPITGQVTEVTCPVIGRAQPELTPSKRQKTGPVMRSFHVMTSPCTFHQPHNTS